MVERYTRGDAEIEAQFAAVEPVGRMGTPEEVAEAVVWLCSRRLHSSRPRHGCRWGLPRPLGVAPNKVMSFIRTDT